MTTKYPIGVFLFLLLSSCMTAQQHREAVQDDTNDRVTVGNVQREIKIGMAGSDVARVLGSPNIVTTDEPHNSQRNFARFKTSYLTVPEMLPDDFLRCENALSP